MTLSGVDQFYTVMWITFVLTIAEIINFTIYKNYNGKIRYKAEGYAKYSDRNGNGGSYLANQRNGK